MLSLSGETPTPVHVDLNGSHWTVKSAPSNEWPPRVSCRVCLNIDLLYISNNPKKFDRLHAEGYLSREIHDIDETPLDLKMIRQRCNAVDMSGKLIFFCKRIPVLFISLF